MHVPITLAALACLTALLIVFRQLWPRLRPSVQRLLLALAIFFILVSALMYALGWNTVSPFVNAGLRWLAVAGYEFILILFTRLRPRWLTTLTATVLLLPILGASIFLPLTFLFDRDPVETTRIAPGLLFTKAPWDAAGMGNRGMDLTLSRIPSRLPLLRNQITTIRLYDTQCDTSATSASFEVATHIVHIHCPPSAAHAGDPPHNIAIRLR
jgi:hypothetical protein